MWHTSNLHEYLRVIYKNQLEWSFVYKSNDRLLPLYHVSVQMCNGFEDSLLGPSEEPEDLTINNSIK